MYSEEGLIKKLAANNKFMSLEQTEMIHICMSTGATDLPTRPNKHYSGSTAGCVLTGVDFPESDWKLSYADKMKLYGDNRTNDQQSLQSTSKSREHDFEPVNYWAMSTKFYEELLHRLNSKAVLDLTCAAELAGVCVDLSIPYLGLCFNPDHAEYVKRRLWGVAFDSMATEGSAHYKSTLAQTVDRLKSGGSQPEEPQPSRPRPTGKAKAKAQGKAKAKAKAAGGPPEPADPSPEPADGPGDDDPGCNSGDDI